MSGSLTTRYLIGAAGIAGIVYGFWSMREFTADQLVSVGLWLAAGPIIHDGVFSFIVLAVGFVAMRVLPPSARKPATVALIVWGTFTVMALPVLSGEGGKPGIATLLGHDYRLNWLIGSAVVLVIVVIATGVSHVSNKRSG